MKSILSVITMFVGTSTFAMPVTTFQCGYEDLAHENQMAMGSGVYKIQIIAGSAAVINENSDTGRKITRNAYALNFAGNDTFSTGKTLEDLTVSFIETKSGSAGVLRIRGSRSVSMYLCDKSEN